jgi:ATP/maltotriose-dependent transcriptional regulator MalT
MDVNEEVPRKLLEQAAALTLFSAWLLDNDTTFATAEDVFNFVFQKHRHLRSPEREQAVAAQILAGGTEFGREGLFSPIALEELINHATLHYKKQPPERDPFKNPIWMPD